MGVTQMFEVDHLKIIRTFPVPQKSLKMYLCRLPKGTTCDKLVQHFSEFGAVQPGSVKIEANGYQRQAFLTISDTVAVRRLVAGHATTFMNRPIHVDVAWSRGLKKPATEKKKKKQQQQQQPPLAAGAAPPGKPPQQQHQQQRKQRTRTNSRVPPGFDT